VLLRLLILKHVRNWSYFVVERDLRANQVYRDFARVGGAMARGLGMGLGLRLRYARVLQSV
jgi:hypothetical protein